MQGHRVYRQAATRLRFLKQLTQRQRRRPIIRLARHRPVDDGGNVLWNAALTQIGHRFVGNPQKLGHHLLAAVPFERRMPGKRAEQTGAHTVHIASRLGLIPTDDLGGGKCRRAHQNVGVRLEAAWNSCDAEITQRRFAIIGKQNIAGLDIAVHDPQPMRRLNRPGHLHAQPQHLVQRKRTHPGDPGVQTSVPAVRHHQEWMATLGFADLQHRHDVRMPG